MILLAAIAVVGSILVGLAPGAWDLFGGLAMAFFMGYILLERVIGEYVTEVQRWAVFALFGTVCVGITSVHAWREGGQLSDELVLSYGLCLALSAFFGYRTVTAR